MTNRTLVALACCTAIGAAGCGSAAHHAKEPDARKDPFLAYSPTPIPGSSPDEIRTAQPKTPWDTYFFKPTLHLRVPADWTANDFDERTLSVIVGSNEIHSPVELSVGGDYERRTPKAAIRTLRSGTGLHATPLRHYRLGRYSALGFDAHGAHMRMPNGFHNGTPDERWRVLAFRGPRAKTLVAVEIGTPKTFDAFTTSAGRVLATLR